MPDTLSQMSPEELTGFIESAVKKAVREELRAFFDDPDLNLDLKDEVISQLKNQAELTSKGERGRSFKDLSSELDLD